MTAVLRVACWWLADFGYAGFWQLRSLVSRGNPDDYRTGSRSPVLVIPGIYESWQFLKPLIVALHAVGHPVHVVPLLRHNRRPVTAGARTAIDYLNERDLCEVTIVAHSKGGLIGKHVMLNSDAGRRVDRMIAICTPFSGSRYARFVPVPSLHAFAPTHRTTRALARERGVNQRITSVFGRFDPMIPDGSVLPGARNIQLDVGGHFRIIGHRRTISAVLRELDLPCGPR